MPGLIVRFSELGTLISLHSEILNLLIDIIQLELRLRFVSHKGLSVFSI